MDRTEKIRKLNAFGSEFGYPFYIFENGEIKKDLQSMNPFKFIVTGLLDAKISLKNQPIMRYETWLHKPSDPNLPDIPQELSVPPYLKPKVYTFPQSRAIVYVYTEKENSHLFEVVPNDAIFRVLLLAPRMQVKQVNSKEKNGEIRVWVYIYRT